MIEAWLTKHATKAAGALVIVVAAVVYFWPVDHEKSDYAAASACLKRIETRPIPCEVAECIVGFLSKFAASPKADLLRARAANDLRSPRCAARPSRPIAPEPKPLPPTPAARAPPPAEPAPSPTPLPAASASPPARVAEAEPSSPASSPPALRTPAHFDCVNGKHMGTDYVICASLQLLDAEARLEDAYAAARTGANGDRIKSEQWDWIKRYGPDCGLPLRGRPSDDKITSAAGCIGDAMEARIKELQAEH